MHFIQTKSVKVDLNILSIRRSIKALIKLNFWCPLPLLVSNKIPKIDAVHSGS